MVYNPMSKIQIDSEELLKLLKYAEIGANVVAILSMYSGIEMLKKDLGDKTTYVSRGIYTTGLKGDKMEEETIKASISKLRKKSHKFKKFKKHKGRNIEW